MRVYESMLEQFRVCGEDVVNLFVKRMVTEQMSYGRAVR